MSAAEFKEETVGIQGGRTGPAGLPESGPCCAGDTGSEDARGALPAAPTRASSASRCRPPRTRALGGHTKGMERSASPGAVDGRRGWDEVAGPRRSLSPRLCLPRSAPPPPPRSPATRGALTLLVTRVSSGLICSPAPSASMAGRPACDGRYGVAPRGSPAAAETPGLKGKRTCVRAPGAHAWGVPGARDAERACAHSGRRTASRRTARPWRGTWSENWARSRTRRWRRREPCRSPGAGPQPVTRNARSRPDRPTAPPLASRPLPVWHRRPPPRIRRPRREAPGGGAGGSRTGVCPSQSAALELRSSVPHTLTPPCHLLWRPRLSL